MERREMSRIGSPPLDTWDRYGRGVREVRLPCHRRLTRRLNGDDQSWHILAHIAARLAISDPGLFINVEVDVAVDRYISH